MILPFVLIFFCRFVLGVEDITEEDRDKIKEEVKLHNDIIYFDDVKNSYFSLTNRTIRVFQHITEQLYTFAYVLKCDDDTFVDVKSIATELHSRKSQGRLYWGEIVVGLVQTEGKWQETQWSTCETYYPYAYGGGYILSVDLVQLVVENEPYLKRYKSEDVSIASWISAYNIERKHDTRFTTGGKPRGCKRVYLMVHKVAIENVNRHYTSLFQNSSICGSNNSWYGFSGYLYNWTAFPPSKECCIRKSNIP